VTPEPLTVVPVLKHTALLVMLGGGLLIVGFVHKADDALAADVQDG